MMYGEKKFFSFPLKKQHKKAAEQLRLCYAKKSALETSYRKLEGWLNLPPVEMSEEALANRFHYHLKKASVSLREHRLLENLKRFDTLSPLPYRPIAIYLDHLRSAHNIGSILRTVEAFRLGTVYFSPEDGRDDTHKSDQRFDGHSPPCSDRQNRWQKPPSKTAHCTRNS